MPQSLCPAVPLWSWCVPLLCLLMFPRGLRAQFPRPCTTPEALRTRECCPLSGGSPCGCSSGRGLCTPHSDRFHPMPFDYRVDWPRFFYDTVCSCVGNFDGFDCSQCRPGWKGPLCDQPHLVERKEVTDLTDKELDTFLSGLLRAKSNISSRYVVLSSDDTYVVGNYKFHNSSVYDLYVWLHYYSSKIYAGSTTNSAHMGPAFAFWHRIFLLFIEREIRDLTGEPDFYIPYWDWTRMDDCNVCTNKYFGGVSPDGHIDSSSPFAQWETICSYKDPLQVICPNPYNRTTTHLIRNPGKSPESRTLPTAEDVRSIMTTEDYDTPPYNTTSANSFRNKLEGFDIPKDSRHLNFSLHNLVHMYVNGDISHVPTSANDPIFMVHHALDKILEDWLMNHKEASYPDSDQVAPAQSAGANMAPFFPLRTNSYYLGLTIGDLGYRYRDHSVPLRTGRRTRGPVVSTEWQWSILDVFGAFLLCACVLAAVRY